MKAKKDFSVCDFRLDYGWRTHGWGNRDEGGKGFISLAKGDLRFETGRSGNFHFAFLPNVSP